MLSELISLGSLLVPWTLEAGTKEIEAKKQDVREAALQRWNLRVFWAVSMKHISHQKNQEEEHMSYFSGLPL